MQTGKTNSDVRSSVNRLGLSALLHCAALSLFLFKGRAHIAPMLLPGDVHGTQLTLTYLPGRAPQPSSAKSKTTVQAVPVSDVKLTEPKLSIPRPAIQPHADTDAREASTASPNTNNSPASLNPNSTTGADSLGTGNINIAYLDSFRSPRPDLSSLPRGVSGDVVLDVTIDTAGKIIALKKLSGVGYGIDESVIATVQAWVFHPATKDGTPVVSEQELHFHYEHSRNG